MNARDIFTYSYLTFDEIRLSLFFISRFFGELAIRSREILSLVAATSI